MEPWRSVDPSRVPPQASRSRVLVLLLSQITRNPASLEAPVSVSPTPGVRFHKHSLSPCSVPHPGLGSAGGTVVTTAALTLPSQDSRSNREDRPITQTVGTQGGQVRNGGPRAHLTQPESLGGLPVGGEGGSVGQAVKQGTC